MPSAGGPETKTAPRAPTATNGPAKKKKKNRVRNRNRNKATTKEVDANIASETTITSQQNLANESGKASKSENQSNVSQPKTNEHIEGANELQTVPKKQENKTEMKQLAANEAPSDGPAAASSREQVMAERAAKKLAKQAKKQKTGTDTATDNTTSTNNSSEKLIKTEAAAFSMSGKTTKPLLAAGPAKTSVTPLETSTTLAEKSREQIKAEREAKKLQKQAAKISKQNLGSTEDVEALKKRIDVIKIAETNDKRTEGSSNAVVEKKKKPTLTKAERRAIQEAQRAAKTKSLIQNSKTANAGTASSNAQVKKTASSIPKANDKPIATSPLKGIAAPTKLFKTHEYKVKLFNHLVRAKMDVNLFVNNSQIHPIIARLGEQYSKRTVVGSNARCIAFLNAVKVVIKDFETPPKKEFARSLEAFIKNCVDHLHNCRPLAVSVSNAYKHIKHVLTQLKSERPESELKENLCHFVDTYLENQIGKAALAISCSMQEKISNGDVILTFGCSSLINYIFEEAHRRHVDFRVIVVDSRPFCEGQELLRRLCAKNIPCTYVLINAVSFVMPEVTKILLGAHALLSNGYVMARTGTAQVALVAHSFNVPVLVCCETHKFSERFQTDAIVYNELGNPDDLVLSDKCCLTNWQAKNKMSPLNLNYDITPPELVTAVVTEVSILPCTSVPVILRIKPAEIGYYN